MSNQNKTIAEKRAELDSMLAWFSSDEFVVEEAADRFARADKLASEIEKDLMTAKNQIVELKRRFDEEASE